MAEMLVFDNVRPARLTLDDLLGGRVLVRLFDATEGGAPWAAGLPRLADGLEFPPAASNLHRAELTALERSEHVAEWVRLSGRVSGHIAQKPKEGRPEGGISAATRELGIDRTDAQRAIKVDALSPSAKQAARDAGLDDNRSALAAIVSTAT